MLGRSWPPPSGWPPFGFTVAAVAGTLFGIGLFAHLQFAINPFTFWMFG